jgi:T5orf172 domain
MPSRIVGPDSPTRPASAGRAFVYVLPCQHEDILKLGFSRDPLLRMQTLHQRYFDFFDIERAFLIETDLVRDARRIERELADSIAARRAPAPLVVPGAAGGHTEWYRGAYSHLLDAAERLGSLQGYALQRSLRPWLSERLGKHVELLYEWVSRMHDEIDLARTTGTDVARQEATLRNALDAFSAQGIALSGRIPENVLQWHEHDRTTGTSAWT